MPSDELVRHALSVTAKARSDFLSSVKTTADQLDGFLRTRKGKTRGASAQLAESLGDFAVGRIDASKLAAFAPTEEASPTVVRAMERAGVVLRGIARLDEQAFLVRAEAFESMATAARRLLGKLGPAFGAAELVAIVRAGRFQDAEADRRLETYHPEDWTARERALAPPVVMVASGESLRGAELRDWLEGRQQVVILADGDCPPAPLAPLISPGVLSGQVHTPAELDILKSYDGPAILALVPRDAAAWLYDPRRTPALEVGHLPDADDLRAIGEISPWRQRQDLALLEALSAPRSAAPSLTNGAGAPAAAPAAKLAAWLLSQADVGGTEED